MRFFRAALVGLAAAGIPAAADELRPAAAITVTDGGAPRPLAALLDGPTVVHLWATWCAPCRAELPELAAFLAEEPALAAHVVVLSVDTAPLARVQAFLDALGVAAPALKIVTGNAGAAFGVRGYPATVLLAADGSVARLRPGALDWAAASVRAEIATDLTRAR